MSLLWRYFDSKGLLGSQKMRTRVTMVFAWSEPTVWYLYCVYTVVITIKTDLWRNKCFRYYELNNWRSTALLSITKQKPTQTLNFLMCAIQLPRCKSFSCCTFFFACWIAKWLLSHCSQHIPISWSLHLVVNIMKTIFKWIFLSLIVTFCCK